MWASIVAFAAAVVAAELVCDYGHSVVVDLRTFRSELQVHPLVGEQLVDSVVTLLPANLGLYLVVLEGSHCLLLKQSEFGREGHLKLEL